MPKHNRSYKDMGVAFNQGDKVVVDGYGDRLFRVMDWDATISGRRNHFILEDWHDKNTPKKKGHLSIRVHSSEKHTIKKTRIMKEESLIPSAKDFLSILESRSTVDQKIEVMKTYGEEVRRTTLEKAAEEARRQLKHDRTEEGVWKIMDSIKDLNQSDRLRIS